MMICFRVCAHDFLFFLFFVFADLPITATTL